MVDPNEQDAYIADVRNMRFERAVNAMVPYVKEDYTFFKRVVLNEFPDMYDALTEKVLHYLHNQLCSGNHNFIVYDIWHNAVYEEAKHRVER